MSDEALKKLLSHPERGVMHLADVMTLDLKDQFLPWCREEGTVLSSLQLEHVTCKRCLHHASNSIRLRIMKIERIEREIAEEETDVVSE